MTDERIKSYLKDRLKKLEDLKNERRWVTSELDGEERWWTTAELGDMVCCKQTLEFIDSLQEEPVSEDLEEAAKNHAVERYRVTRDMVLAEKCKWSFMVGAEWQKQQDQSTIELAEDHAMLAGMEKMREQMMKDAIERTVKVDAGGYPYIDCDGIELYDYENDKPLAKKGQKAKVIIILED